MDQGNSLNESIHAIKKFIKSKEVLCAMYAYDYERNNHATSYEEFLKIWNESSFHFKEKVVSYFYSFNNFEMLKRLTDINNLGKAHRIIDEFIKNKHANELLEKNQKIMKKVK